jgi:hypothetical protein
VKGKVSFLGLNIKNNAGAGDICWHSGTRQPKGTFTILSAPIPAADFNACGDEFTDPDVGLNLHSYIQTGDSKASVTIDVTYPDPPEPEAFGGDRFERGTRVAMSLGQRNAPDLAPSRNREWVRENARRSRQHLDA